MPENLPDTNVGNIEYIRKQDALDAFGLSEKTRKYGGDHSGYDTRMLYEIQDTIESLKPADVAPVRHGHWTRVGWHKGMKVVECSCCKKRAIGSTDFCPNCGAKMDREE